LLWESPTRALGIDASAKSSRKPTAIKGEIGLGGKLGGIALTIIIHIGSMNVASRLLKNAPCQ